MLKHNKTIAIVMAFVFCMSFLAPAFIAPAVAQAASTATVVKTSNLAQVDYSAIAGQDDVGVIKVTISDFDFLTTPTAGNPWIATVTFPTKLAEDNPAVDVAGDGRANAVLGAGAERIWISYPSGDNALAAGDVVLEGVPAPGTGGAVQVAAYGTFDLKVTGLTDPSEDGVFYIHFADFDCTNFGGDIIANFKAGSKVFTDAFGLKLGTVNAAFKTSTVAKSVRAITSSGGTLDNITIMDIVAGSIGSEATDIKLEMVSKGFEFEGANPAAGYQKFDNSAGAVTVTDDEITYVVPAAAANGQTKGVVGLSGIEISVDEKVARVGQDIKVRVSGAGITEETIVVGKYVDYLVNITLDKATELIAGRDGENEGQVLGTFFIEEVAPGTLVGNRSILLELPAGLAWNDSWEDFGADNYEVVNNSSIAIDAISMIDSRTLKLEVERTSANSEEGAKILFKNLTVDVSPSFAGAVDLKISGKAGAEGVVAGISTVIPMIKMEATTPDVMLGVKEQKVSDVIITEAKADALVDRDAWISILQVLAAELDQEEGIFATSDTALKFYLDEGFRFSKVPKVEVLEGDIVLELDDVKITTPRSGQNMLIIPIRAGSYNTPAKIKISDIYVTADRNAPTGKIALYAAETGADLVNGEFLSDYANAFNDTNRFRLDRAAEVYIANNATEPPVENVPAGTATFVIDSNIYTVNGVTRVMDCAPYIKNGRTFVPYRYLAYALGVAEADVVWDAAAKTVTVTKGDTVVVATIGSTTLTVNGAAKTMDVAPELVNDRTMLPARHLAEALGATVGWDPATRTVVIEN
ncbi:MAG: copper amine oxidase N-terminal domain-containing protein [Syntrophomonadaceae bacterium]|nr:copper amine oxidase N-terminal domain-containing protein [Syntrophomonadaceae bacterium]